MTSRHRHRSTHRAYRLKKAGIKDEYIDKQICVLHAAIAKKVIANPELVDSVTQTLERYREQGKIGYGAYITWLSILQLAADKALFLAEMTRDDRTMRRLRRKTPFIGILTECERKQALEENAIAIIDDVSVLW
ncbi:hypothetical protein QWY77_00070 [Thalassotalea ponticola]|uniref:hypothetical protein n=1 Tax=Thalassotalea ponticola TaxID=1523392 RepID=UPI0025B354E0|nr:hypothetical protein [Thalassotalea ponticola]MDN3651182.1 hypothetical protein [Thalassotalea ponticola]